MYLNQLHDKNQLLILGNFIFILLSLVQSAWACSGYKITVGDKTIVGCNEDAWRATPHIWFENTGRFGAAFTGSRFDGPHGYAPQAE